jgi:hypothetical protein
VAPGVPVDDGTFLDVGSPVVAPFGLHWWRAVIVAAHSRDRFTVRFDDASPFWDSTLPRSALQVPAPDARGQDLESDGPP